MAEGGTARGLRRLSDVLGAALAALLAFTAVPAVLVVVVGDPLAGGLGHAWPVLTRDALFALTAAAWLAWAACCAQLLRAVVARVRRGDVGAVAGVSVLDRLAARIAVGVLALTAVGGPLAISSDAGALAPTRASVTLTVASGAGVDATASPAAVPMAGHVVRPGDTLWSIAHARLGDGADWTAIAALNLGRDVATGARFVDPDHIRAGWHLRLPDDGDRDRDPSAPPSSLAGRQPRRELPAHLPELVALGLGSLTCAALARRSRRQRRLDRFGDDLDQLPLLSEPAVDTAALLDRFHGVPALAAFEKANCLLGSVVHERAGAPSPMVRAICVGPSGVTFWLAQPDLDAPGGFTAGAGGATWEVEHSALEDVDVFYPYVPVALPVGDDDDGTWLVAVRPGDVLPVLGDSAPALCRAARSALESWTWADMVTVTEDPADPRLADRAAHDPLTSGHCVFFGSPDTLTAAQARRAAVVTTATVAATDLTVLVDGRGATLHPLGRVVHPQLQSERTAEHIAELTAPPAERALRVGDTVTRARRGRRQPGTGSYAPGLVDVRLLTMTPRLDGLREELAPNRSRRAVELVAYLALHHPDEISGDRLRTRVLGSSDTDAASKTLFNTAHAARRAMGLDDQGDPLFPAGTRNGMYQLSPEVSVDVHRAIAFVRAGQEQADSDLAIAHFRAALELVEGEPLANALSGYSWWEAEGHGGRIAAVLVDAACIMATLATEAGLFDLARWGLERARLVEPYSEALSRAAMEVAAAEGDADRLRFEWRECQRRVDALDPGSSPSIRTESLYGELHHRVLAGARRPERGSERYAPLSD